MVQVMDERKILFLTTQIIVPPTDGGKQCTYYRVRAIAEQQRVQITMFNHENEREVLQKNKIYFPKGLSVSLIEPFHRDVKGSSWYHRIYWGLSWLLSGKCRWEKLLSSQQVTAVLMQKILTDNIRIVVLENPFLATLIDIPKLRRERIRILLVEHNVEYKYFLDSLRLPAYIATLEARRIHELEKRVIGQVNRTICISPQDSRDLQQEFGVGTVCYLPPILSSKERCWTRNTSKQIVFTGGLSFYPNLHGIMWLLEHIWSDFLLQYPDYKLVITGKVSDAVKQKLAAYPSVKLTGFLTAQELEDCMIGAQFVVVPIIKGSGVKIKLLEALSYGIPVVTTEESHRGVMYDALQEDVPYMHTSDPRMFLEYMCRMASDLGLCERLGMKARIFFDRTYASNTNLRAWLQLLNEGIEE